MAIYHFSGTIISRSQGRSAVACAAYRSAKQLHDERYAKTHNYSKKQDVVLAEILLPDNAPNWMRDRETLWNAVEQGENRKDAQLAREFNFALPQELTLEQNIALAKSFVTSAFVSQGMVADLCIHNDKKPNGQRQPHAHVMLTLREVTPLGFGKKVRAWNAKENLKVWRERWAEVANQHLALQGLDLRIDHRSLQAQGIDLEPQYKIGATVARERLVRFEDHQRIARQNGERLFKDPNIALEAITQQQSTFTQHDLARFVHRHTGNSEQFQAVFEKVKASSEIRHLGQGERGEARFTTHALHAIETEMLNLSQQLNDTQRHGVDPRFKSKALRLRSLTEEQHLAYDHLLSWGNLKCVVGYAGTGKSYLLGACRQAWEGQGYRVLGATLSGIAAENLTGSSGIESRTLASHFHTWDQGGAPLTARDILVVDEAGMIGSRQMAKVLQAVKAAGAKLILIGDPAQLQAIQAGAAFRGIAQASGYVELTEVRRQQPEWQRAATRELALGEVEAALLCYERQNHLHAFDTEGQARDALIALWNDARLSHSQPTQIMLVYTRQDAQILNEMARSLRQSLGELGEDHTIQTARGERVMAVQDRVYCLKNDRAIGVMNGSLGTIEAISGSLITIRLDAEKQSQDRVVKVDLNAYNHLDHGYAATLHKAQGVTVDRSYLLSSPYLDRHATYVALSRHRHSVDIFWSQEVFANRQALLRTLSRERGKDLSLDYGLEPLAPLGKDRPVSQRENPLKAKPAHEVGLSEGLLERLSKRFKALGKRFASRQAARPFKTHEADPPDLAHKPERGEQRAEAPAPAAHAPQVGLCGPPARIVAESDPSVLAIRGRLLEFIERELVQETKVRTVYTLTEPAERQALWKNILSEGKALGQVARSLLSDPRVNEALQNPAPLSPKLPELGGYLAIKARLEHGSCTPQDLLAVARQLRQRTQSYQRSLRQKLDRGRTQ